MVLVVMVGLTQSEHVHSKAFELWGPRVNLSVDAWYATTVDIEEVLSNTRQGDFHIFVADVVKSFDTVDRDILPWEDLDFQLDFKRSTSRSIGRLGYVFELADCLGVAWTWDGGISQGCPLSMVFIVAHYAPWCQHFESLGGISHQLYADNLKCTSYNVNLYWLLPGTRCPMSK